MRKIAKICIFLLIMTVILTINLKVFALSTNEVSLPNSHVADTSGAKYSLDAIMQYVFKGLVFVYIICSLFVLYELITGKSNRIINNIIMVLSIIIVLVGKVYLMVFIPVLLALKGATKNRALKVIINIVLLLCLILTMYVLWTGIRPVFMPSQG